MKIDIRSFSNSIPKVDPHLLPIGRASVAINCDLQSGSLTGVPALEFLQLISHSGDIRACYRLGDNWLAWTTYVDVVKAQLPQLVGSVDGSVPTDTSTDRIFFTGNGYPQQTDLELATSGDPNTYPTNIRRLGVLPPSQPLTAVEPQGTGDGTLGESISYYYTYVTSIGEESRPAPATSVVTLENGEYARVKGFVFPSLLSSGNEVTHYRLYRAVPGTDGTVTFNAVFARPGSFSNNPVYDIPVGSVPDTNTYVYDVDSGTTPTNLNQEFGDACPSELWDPPPENLVGLTQYRNGVIAGFHDKTVYLSEPLIPYAYPALNNYVVAEDIVGLGVFKNNIVVATNSFPTILQGTDPSMMSQFRWEVEYACLSKDGIVSTPLGVMYPCAEGLLRIDGSSAEVLTEKLLTQNQWLNFGPENLLGFFYEGKYLGFFKGSTTGIMLDFGDISGVTLIDLGYTVHNGFIDPVSGELILLLHTAHGGYSLYVWDSDAHTISNTRATFVWKSGDIETPHPTNFRCVRVTGEFSNGITVKIFADQQLRREFVARGGRDDYKFFIPGKKRARYWSVELRGIGKIKHFVMSHTLKEMGQRG